MFPVITKQRVQIRINFLANCSIWIEKTSTVQTETKISAYLIEGYSETRRMHYIRYLRLYYLMLGTVCGM
jgi:hypothetical protein